MGQSFDEFWRRAINSDGRVDSLTVDELVNQMFPLPESECVYDHFERVSLEEAQTHPASIQIIRDVLMPQYRTPENDRLGWVAGLNNITRYITLLQTIPELGIQEEMVIHLHPRGEYMLDGTHREWTTFTMAYATHTYHEDKSRIVSTRLQSNHTIPSGETIEGIFTHLPYLAKTIRDAVRWSSEEENVPEELNIAYQFVDYIESLSEESN